MVAGLLDIKFYICNIFWIDRLIRKKTGSQLEIYNECTFEVYICWFKLQSPFYLNKYYCFSINNNKLCLFFHNLVQFRIYSAINPFI